MNKHENDEVVFGLEQAQTDEAQKDAQAVRLSVRVENGKLQVCTGVRSGAGEITASGTGFIAVNAPFKLATRA